ncbi:MAG: hypothetical protein M3Q75_12170 [Gemmatimonadota bacterium]|nr:hypothetical protein [Gemmatimonadota bacterium]
MRPHQILSSVRLSLLWVPVCVALAAGCGDDGGTDPTEGTDGPANPGVPVPRQDGDPTLGREVFRFETFNNERFFTDALRLGEGITAAGVTPLQVLELGVNVDIDALPADIVQTLAAELQADPSGQSSALLNDPAMTATLLNANAVIGLPTKDSNGDGVIDVAAGDKAGTSCALCHTRADDGATFTVPNGGSIGPRGDGLATHNLNFGGLMAVAANSRALYPLLQLSLSANGGQTLGRAPTGLTESSTEAEVDAYLSNPQFYPVGMFDDTFDGNGDPMHNAPLFRQDLAAPFGSEGTFEKLDQFSNLVYTGLFDPTTLTTPGGRAFLNKLGGAAGDEIANDYVQVLAETGVTGYPFVVAAPAAPGQDAPLGIRVDDTKLFAMNAYLAGLQAPSGMGGSPDGRQLFRTVGCTDCHNVDQGRPVPTFIVPMATIFPGDAPVTLATRVPPLNPVLNTAASIFDDKMVIVNASIRGDIRGTTLPLLLDLARKPVFLHDNSVPTLDNLLDPARGATAPHPFYLTDPSPRAQMVAFLQGRDTDS